MNNLNELAFFKYVVDYQGYSSASRATGIEKTRLSRSITALEKRIGVKLLQRTTRKIVLTEAGKLFYEKCKVVIAEADTAYNSISILQKEPSGMVRIACPVILAQSYLAEILPGYLARYPKVSIHVEATDRSVDLIAESFDVVLRADPVVEESGDLVARKLDIAQRIMVASPHYLAQHAKLETLNDLVNHDIICHLMDIQDTKAMWELVGKNNDYQRVDLLPRMTSNDLRVHLNACLRSVGIGLFPQKIVNQLIVKGQLVHVLPEYSAKRHIIHMVYPRPVGMLPSIRSLIDYLQEHLHDNINDLDIR